jgi:hypothetical protein
MVPVHEKPTDTAEGRIVAILDIGTNSIRILIVFGRGERIRTAQPDRMNDRLIRRPGPIQGTAVSPG